MLSAEIKNVSDKDIVVTHNANPYMFPAGKKVTVPRELVNHALKHSITQQDMQTGEFVCALVEIKPETKEEELPKVEAKNVKTRDANIKPGELKSVTGVSGGISKPMGRER